MRKFTQILLLFIISLLFTFCNKEEIIKPINVTNFDINIIGVDGVDTLYLVDKAIVTSSNDSVINYAKIKVIDENNTVIFYDYWKKLNRYLISLSERKLYKLKFILINNEKTIKTIEKNIDNKDYPDKIQIINISLNINVSNIPSINNNYENQVIIYGDENGEALIYLFKFYPDDSPSFTISDLYIPTTQYKNSDNGIEWEDWWADYVVSVGYAQGSGDDFYGYKRYTENISIYKIIESNNIQPNIMYQYRATKDFIITYKCIYEK